MAVTDPFDVVVFDLGGVVVDLSGLDAFLVRHRLDPADFWARWLGMGAVGEFERGGCDADEFAATFIGEFDLDIAPAQFLDEFARWPGGLLPGAADLVRAVPVRTASLSNTNAIHWDGAFMVDELLALFDDHFPSFRLGLAKPDAAIFARVVELLEVPASRVRVHRRQPGERRRRGERRHRRPAHRRPGAGAGGAQRAARAGVIAAIVRSASARAASAKSSPPDA